MMVASIYLFGVLALPFAGFTSKTYSHLNALSALYVLINAASGLYTVIEASYIPIFMCSVGWAMRLFPMLYGKKAARSVCSGSSQEISAH